MAIFLDPGPRAAQGHSAGFTDTGGLQSEGSIDSLAAAGITTGCTSTQFCPNDNVTRGQMAAFLVRALEH